MSSLRLFPADERELFEFELVLGLTPPQVKDDGESPSDIKDDVKGFSYNGQFTS